MVLQYDTKRAGQAASTRLNPTLAYTKQTIRQVKATLLCATANSCAVLAIHATDYERSYCGVIANEFV